MIMVTFSISLIKLRFFRSDLLPVCLTEIGSRALSLSIIAEKPEKYKICCPDIHPKIQTHFCRFYAIMSMNA